MPLLLFLALLAATGDSNDTRLQAVLDGYQANMALVDNVTITSDYALASAKLLDEATDPKLKSESIGKGIFAHAGQDVRIEMVFAESQQAAFPSLQSVWRDKVTAQFYPKQRLLVIGNNALSTFYGAADPFDLGVTGPKGVDAIGELLHRAIAKQKVENVKVAEATVDGSHLLRVSFDDVYNPSRARHHEIDFDSAHGFIPVAHTAKVNDRPVFALRVDGFYHLPDGGWIPHRVSYGERRGRTRTPTPVQVTVITFAEPQKIDGKSKLFELTLGDGIQVNDIIGKLNWRTGAGFPTTINLATYDRSAIAKLLAQQPASVAATSAPASWWRQPVWYVGAGIGVALLLIALFLVRKQSTA